jgi:hypothetical protein
MYIKILLRPAQTLAYSSLPPPNPALLPQSLVVVSRGQAVAPGPQEEVVSVVSVEALGPLEGTGAR